MRAVAYRDLLWKNGQDISVSFQGGDSNSHELIKTCTEELERYANVRFEFVKSKHLDIRISFHKLEGWYSYIGIGALNVDKDIATMNLAVVPGMTGRELRRDTLHELLHALGFHHEHSSPNANILWKHEIVIKDYKRTQNWGRDETYAQVLQKLDEKVVEASEYDPRSIMHYPVESTWTCDGSSVGQNDELSETDKIVLAKKYPKPAQPVVFLSSIQNL